MNSSAFTILEVAADWHELVVLRRGMQPSTARDSGQVDPRRGGLMAQADRLGPKVGSHLASCYIHRMNRGELSRCFKHDDNTIKIILVLLSLILSYMATSSDRDCCLLYTVTLGCFIDS